MPKTILLIDDEQGIRDFIKEYMVLEDYVVLEASDGADGLSQFKSNEVSLVVLDIMMPKMDGWTVCREIRKTSRVPIIMLSARGEEYDKLFGFELGVDDYMVKPFSPKELLARMKAIFLRSQEAQSKPLSNPFLEAGGLSIDFDARDVQLDGERLVLSPKEYELLVLFCKNPNKVFSREQLLNLVWGYEFIGDDRTVDTHIKTLRERLKDRRRWIVTVWGIGYKFSPEEKE